jgi:osmoprotectant transport system permease protein
MTRGLLLTAAALAAGCGSEATRVGSKVDNESVLLGEMATQLIRSTGTPAEHRQQLGGTPVVWQALLAGEVDVYPEFTGTLAFQTLNDPSLVDFETLKAALAAKGIGVTRPLGYENNYALGIRAAVFNQGVTKVSDLARHPGLRLGLSTEFTQRADGWPALKRHYGLPQKDPDGLEHGLAYRTIAAGGIDVTDVYTTDAEIARYDLRVLADDRGFFPHYAAVIVYRQDWADRHPAAAAALTRLEGALDEPAVRRMNGRTLVDKVPESETAAAFLREKLGVAAEAEHQTPARRVLRHTREHLFLVAVSLTAAVLVAVPLGVLAAKRPRLGRAVIGFASLVQTIPSLALLVFMVTLPGWLGGGLGWEPAVIALFLYSLLPIVRNTAAGLSDITPSLREAADGLGLTAWQKLRLVELPLASRSILAGVKTAAVINVGTATLGALIDAGGLGVPIQQGLRTNDPDRILLGAVPAAALALLAEGLFELLERVVVPKGLRLAPAR